MNAVRPKVAELLFRLYGRSLHPELFEVYQTREIKRGDYSAKIQITSAGHLVTWRFAGLTLTEVAVASNHPLPEKRRLMSHKLRGETSDAVDCHGGCRYEVNFQLDTISPEIFWGFQQQLVTDGQRKGMLHSFDASGRVALGALSYINIETRNKCLSLQAFHTFPDDRAIVKSQSRFILP